ncbi:MAG: hypothetical protein ACP5OO_10040 [Chloroflexia bacterium]
MRIAYFYPAQLAAARLYNRALLPALAEEVEIHCFIETDAPAESDPSLPTFGADTFLERDIAAPYDVCVYLLGDHPAYRFVWEALRRRPGVILMLSLGLHRLLASRPADPAYPQAMAEEYGDLGRALAESWPGTICSPWDNVAIPLGGFVASYGWGTLVHTREALRTLSARLPALPVAFVPRPLPADPPVVESPQEIRKRLGIRPYGPIIASFGPLPLLHLLRLIRALGRLLPDHPDVLFLIAAPDPTTAALWEEALRSQRLLGAAHVCEIGASSATAAEIVSLADIGIYLDWSTPGEMPEMPLRLMAAAKASLLPAGHGWGEFPPDCCAYVDPGPQEEELLWAYLDLLLRRPDLRQRLGQNAQTYVVAHHAPAVAAREIRRFLEVVRAVQEQREELAPDVPPYGPVPSDRAEEGLALSEQVDVEQVMGQVYQHIGEQYLVERLLLPTFAYRPPPTARNAEDMDLFQNLDQASQIWQLPERSTGLRAYLREISSRQTAFNACVVRVLNHLFHRLFRSDQEDRMAALEHALRALHHQVTDLENRLMEGTRHPGQTLEDGRTG